jgi:starch-binding outer membrane protein, SusD/RagB family
MRTILYIITITCLTLFTAGCEKYLEIDPVNEQPDTDVLKSKNNVLAVLYAAYDRVQSGNFIGGQAIEASEIYGDNVDLTVPALVTSQDYGPFANRNFGIFNNVGRNTWGTAYSAIYNANIVIDAVDKNMFSDATDVEKSLFKAEALFIRGLSHHFLVRLFALPYSNNPNSDPGVPLRIIRPAPDEALTPTPRAKVAEVYTQVIADLKAAEQVLPATNGGRATKWSAKALLARVYFDMGDYNNAYIYANDVIVNGSFTLGANVLSPFRNAGATQADGGVIFQVINVAGDDGSGTIRGHYWNTNPANVFMPVTSELYALYLPVDARRTMLINQTGSNKPFSLKIQGANPVNIPVIRLAEMYLTRAESAVRKGGYNAADVREDYNKLRRLAGVPEDLISSTDTALLSAIQNERRLELAMEGDRYYELRRLKQQIRGLAFNDKTQLMKIPDSETRANPDIEQN